MLQARYHYGYVGQTEWLEVPWTMHGAMAEQAFAAEDWLAVERALKVCYEIKPGEADFFVGWIRRLQQAGQAELATAWKAKLGGEVAANE